MQHVYIFCQEKVTKRRGHDVDRFGFCRVTLCIARPMLWSGVRLSLRLDVCLLYGND